MVGLPCAFAPWRSLFGPFERGVVRPSPLVQSAVMRLTKPWFPEMGAF